MDWFSWLSKSGLDPSLIYEYGLAFARNELQYEDITYFNHEFLQSMGISVAKHRLEILKLARKETSGGGGGPGSLSGLILAINKTKKRLNKCISKWVFREDLAFKATPVHYPEQYWSGGLLRRHKSKDVKEEKPVLKKRSITLSGPLDRVQERMIANTRSLKLSGPLDGRVQEKLMYSTRSPRLSGPLDKRVQDKMMFTARSPKFPGPIDGWVPERLTVTTKNPNLNPIPNPNPNPKLSGPLDGRVQDRFVVTSRSPRLSGPLDSRVASPMAYSQFNQEKVDGRVQDRFVVTSRSPRSSGPLDSRVASPMVYSQFNQEKVDVDYDDHSLWAIMFHDMKPT